MKTCTKCGVQKPLSEYSKRYDYADIRYRPYCKSCTKEYSKNQHIKNKNKRKNQKLVKAYGITLAQKMEMIENQNNKCAICNIDLNSIKSAHVDHCHTTNKVRGILCTKCNPGIGYFQDNLKLLKSAIKYLKKHQKK